MEYDYSTLEHVSKGIGSNENRSSESNEERVLQSVELRASSRARMMEGDK